MISELLILSARVCKTGIINKVLLSNYGRNKNQCPSPVIVHRVGELRVEYFPSELTFLTSLMRIKVILFHLRCFLPLNSFICIKKNKTFCNICTIMLQKTVYSDGHSRVYDLVTEQLRVLTTIYVHAAKQP